MLNSQKENLTMIGNLPYDVYAVDSKDQSPQAWSCISDQRPDEMVVVWYYKKVKRGTETYQSAYVRAWSQISKARSEDKRSGKRVRKFKVIRDFTLNRNTVNKKLSRHEILKIVCVGFDDK